ncbi:MAG: alpha/beta hydrolase [Burkholderiaceae bacterium]
MSRPTVLFLHANGFPSGSYRQFLEALGRHAEVIAPPALDTPSSMRPRLRWPDMTRQVVTELRRLAEHHGPVCLVGHSMGGYLSMMAAARLPAHVRHVVLIDSPIVVGWRQSLLETLSLTGLSRRGGPAPIAARRRDRWASPEFAHAYFSAKAFVRDWAPGVLDDFLAHALAAGQDGAMTLRIAREAERDIYAHLPARRTHAAFRALRSHGGIGLHLIAGTRSRETEMAGRAINRRLFGANWHELATGHLVPMEKPIACAELVARCIGAVHDGSPGDVLDGLSTSPSNARHDIPQSLQDRDGGPGASLRPVARHGQSVHGGDRRRRRLRLAAHR